MNVIRILQKGEAILAILPVFLVGGLIFAAALPVTLVKFEGDQLLRPEGYREWVYLGTPITPNDMNGGAAPFPDFHNVYIDPESWVQFKNTGEFRDGTVIVKELVGVGTKQASSGKGYFMGEFIGLETTIKDSKRFPDDPGNWAFFSFGHEYPLADKAGKRPIAECAACHRALAATDMVFTQYYPVARAGSEEE